MEPRLKIQPSTDVRDLHRQRITVSASYVNAHAPYHVTHMCW